MARRSHLESFGPNLKLEQNEQMYSEFETYVKSDTEMLSGTSLSELAFAMDEDTGDTDC